MFGIYFKILGGESQWRHIKYVTQNWPIVYNLKMVTIVKDIGFINHKNAQSLHGDWVEKHMPDQKVLEKQMTLTFSRDQTQSICP